MIEMIEIVRIEIQRKDGECYLVATNSAGGNIVLGTTPTERGAKSMLTRRAKQFNLTVSGETAAK